LCPPLKDADPPNNDNGIDVEEEKCMFKNVKMYTDGGNGCFTHEEILAIYLLGII
jgi:hypothetical protein